MDGALVEAPQSFPLSQVAEELGGEAAEWPYFVTRKVQHDLGGRLTDAQDAAMAVDDQPGFDTSMAEAERLKQKIAMLFRDLHGSSDQGESGG